MTEKEEGFVDSIGISLVDFRSREVKLETDRLALFELIPSDASFHFLLDSNSQVQEYCERKVITHIDSSHEYIRRVRAQYVQNGIGRWIVFLKESDEDIHPFIGWAGLKIESDVNGHERFVDLGFRILPDYWNKGYMTEAGKALVRYGFEVMKYEKIAAYLYSEHIASAKVLEKCGLRAIEEFIDHDDNDAKNTWFEMSRDEYEALRAEPLSMNLRK
jgi:RimJ/RimL family protein N-acetyltransferase